MTNTFLLQLVIVALVSMMVAFAAALIIVRHHMRKCGSHRTGSFEKQLGRMVKTLGLTGPQQIAWEELVQAVVWGKSALDEFDEVLSHRLTVEQRINRMEDYVSDSSAVIKRIKPFLLAFYHSLDDGQRARFDSNWYNSKICYN